MTENLINRISFYLASGGLFNPELADHLAVRNLLMECREALAQRTWVGLTDEEVNKLVDDEDWYNDPHKFSRIVEAKVREKNYAS